LLASDPIDHIYKLDAPPYASSPENLKELPDPARQIFIHGDICDRPLLDDLFQRYRIGMVVKNLIIPTNHISLSAKRMR
jgi:dTDP-glucose 4,6-dehydratase